MPPRVDAHHSYRSGEAARRQWHDFRTLSDAERKPTTTGSQPSGSGIVAAVVPPVNNYRAYLLQWAAVIDGKDPWTTPIRLVENGYGPLHDLYGLLVLIDPALPRVSTDVLEAVEAALADGRIDHRDTVTIRNEIEIAERALASLRMRLKELECA